MDRQPSYATMTIHGSSAPTDRTFGVVNPATGDVFAEAPDCTREQLDAAMESAQRAFEKWSADDEASRVQIMHECAAAVEENAEAIARIQTLEQGRPFRSSVEYVHRAAHHLRYYADVEIPRVIVQDDDDAFIEVVRRPTRRHRDDQAVERPREQRIELRGRGHPHRQYRRLQAIALDTALRARHR